MIDHFQFEKGDLEDCKKVTEIFAFACVWLVITTDARFFKKKVGESLEIPDKFDAVENIPG